jgi:hypothetical protein
MVMFMPGTRERSWRSEARNSFFPSPGAWDADQDSKAKAVDVEHALRNAVRLEVVLFLQIAVAVPMVVSGPILVVRGERPSVGVAEGGP